MLKQDKAVPLPFEKEVAIIFVAGAGEFNDAHLSMMKDIVAKFFAMLESQYPTVLKAIAESKDLPEPSQTALKEAAQMFKKEHKELFITK